MRRVPVVALLAALVGAAVWAPVPVRADHHPGTAPSDFNGDGYGDLAVGVPSEDAAVRSDDVGRVVVLYGGRRGLTSAGAQSWSAATPGLARAPGTSSTAVFGVALATGDFDDDGHADLAVAGEYRDAGLLWRRGVWILYGSTTGLSAAGSRFLTGDMEGSPGSLGMALATGDMDGDGYADLVAGSADAPAPGGTTLAALTLVRGGPDGLSDAGTMLWSTPSVYASSMGLAIGDLDGDSATDAAVGLDGIDPGGSVTVVYGDLDGMVGDRIALWSQDVPGVRGSGSGNREHDEFGAALAIGDFDGDHFGDLAVGVPAEDIARRSCGRDTWGDALAPYGLCDQGAVHVFRGSGSGLAATGNRIWTRASAGVPGVPMANDRFGTRLSAGDFDGDGRDDLAIGAPDDGLPFGHAEAIARAGSVTILYGSGAGLGPDRATTWSQQTPGVPGPAAAGDSFGSALAALNVGHGPRTDLIVGISGDRARSARAGMLVVLFGAPEGLTARDAQAWSQASPGVVGASEMDDAFGSVLGR